MIHSATKFLGGHGTTLGGVVIESGRFDWGNGNFPQMTEPVPSYGGLSWWGNFQEFGFLTKLRAEQLRDIGASLSPHSAFLLIQGVETLPQRMEAHMANARTVAEWLDADPRVSFVRWAGLPGHPHHDRAARYLPLGPGAVFSFGVRGGRAAGQRFIESVQLCSHLANVGDARTLVIHPGSTTHQQLDRRPAARRGCAARPRADQRRAGGRRGHPVGPRPGARRRREGGVVTWENPSATRRQQILRATRTVAVVGASPNPARASNFVATYLLASTDYDVYFVNPNATEILGRPVYKTLADLPVVPDLVDVFRRREDLPAVLDEVLALDGVRTFWLQFGLFDEDVARRAEAAGLEVVMDRCLKVEHARFHGGLHLAGFDTGVISSRRRAG